jgi:hypothetical protein
MTSLGAAFGIVAAIATIDWLHTNSVIDDIAANRSFGVVAAMITSILAPASAFAVGVSRGNVPDSFPDEPVDHHCR